MKAGAGIRALLEHPLHPILAHFPVALLLAAPLAQAWHLYRGDAFSDQLQLVVLVAGLVMALPAALAGSYDAWRNIFRPQQAQAYNMAAAHVMAMVTALLIFCGALICLLKGQDGWALGLSVVGALSVTLGGFFGGSLVYLLGVGVRKP